MASEETQEVLHSREITNPAVESRQELRSMIHHGITKKLSSRRPPVPAKEVSGVSKAGEAWEDSLGLVVPQGFQRGSEA